MMKFRPLVFGLIAGCFLMGANAGLAKDDVPPSTPLTTEQRIYVFSTFWKEVSYNFAHWEGAGDLDWDKSYQDFLPGVLAARDDFEFYRELQRFCALLKDGHTNVWMPKGLLEKHVGRIPLMLREIDHRAIVRNTDKKLKGLIPVGSEILEIDGRTVREIVEEEAIPFISTSAPHIYWETAIASWRSVGVGVLFGPKGSTARLKIQKPDGQFSEISIPRDQYERKVEWVIKTPRAPVTEFEMLDGEIAYMALNDFSSDEVVTEFRDRLPELSRAKGIIIDLRRNGGGSSLNSSAIVGHFTDRNFKGASWRTPVHDGAYKAWGKAATEYKNLEKYSDYYYGHVYRYVEATEHEPSARPKLSAPTLVLIGRKTASAAEDFLIMADGIEHISYMGEPTHGSTGQPLSLEFPGGGRARISAKRDFYPDGREFIGVGVRPDIEVIETVEDFRAGRDIVLERALKTLRQGNR